MDPIFHKANTSYTKDCSKLEITTLKAVYDLICKGSARLLQAKKRYDACTSDEQRTQVKLTLPTAFFPGLFHRVALAEKFYAFSGYMSFDVDNFSKNKNFYIEYFKKREEVLLIHTTISGKGLRVVSKIANKLSTETFAELYSSLREEYEKELGITITNNCSVRNGNSLCYDPEAYHNPNAKPINILPRQASGEDNRETDNDTILDKLEVWLDRSFPMQRGNRNKNLYIFAGACNNFLVPIDIALRFALDKWVDPTFDTKEIENVFQSAYSKTPSPRYFKISSRVEVPAISINSNTGEPEYIPLHTFKVLGKNRYKLKFDRKAILKFLRDQEVFYLKPDECYYQIRDNIIYPTFYEEIFSLVDDYINKSYPAFLGHNYSKIDMIELMYDNFDKVGIDKVLRVNFKKELKINEDTEETSFFYFKNGFVKVTAEGYTLRPYKELPLPIPLEYIKDREFKNMDPSEGQFTRFLQLISYHYKSPRGEVELKTEKRYEALLSLLGYLMHGYLDVDRKIVEFTDSSLDTDDNGGTGKSLLLTALGHMTKVARIDGTSYNYSNNHKFQAIGKNTQLVAFNDVSNFMLRSIYNAIVDAFEVNPKNAPLYEVQCKSVLTDNKPLDLKGGTDKRRVITYELANYFSVKHVPKNEFGNWFFSKKWPREEWSAFDNLMVSAAQTYLREGILSSENINLAERKLILMGDEFYDFFKNYKFKEGEWEPTKNIYSAFKAVSNLDITAKAFTQKLITFLSLDEQVAPWSKAEGYGQKRSVEDKKVYSSVLVKLKKDCPF